MLCVFATLLLAVWEVIPRSLSVSDLTISRAQQTHFEICAIVELILLLLHALDLALKVYGHDWRVAMDFWSRAKLLALVANLAELLVVWALRGDGDGSEFSEPLRLLRCLRVIYLIEKGRAVQRVLVAILATVPKVLSVFLILFVWVSNCEECWNCLIASPLSRS